MALQSSGAISLLDIANEFGGAAPHAINEYYGAASGIPTSGAISISDFYGASSISWDLSVISFTNKTYSPSNYYRFGLDFKPDSSQMFIGNSSTIQTYTLSTPGDITTATLTATGRTMYSALPNPQPQETAGFAGASYSFRRFRFNPSGTKLTMFADKNLFQFNLSTPWDTSSSSMTYASWTWLGSLGYYGDDIGFDNIGQSSWIPVFPNSNYTWHRGYGSNYAISGVMPTNVSTGLNQARLLIFKPDGTKVFLVSYSGSSSTYTLITEHDLSTPFNITTINSTPNATYDAAVNPVFASNVFGFWINPAGKALYILDYNTTSVKQFNL